MKNEVTNVFGNSNVIFSQESEASSIIKTILSDKRFLQSKKKLFLEETINKQQFIAPNWRPFDCIYWLAQRSVRKAEKGQYSAEWICILRKFSWISFQVY